MILMAFKNIFSRGLRSILCVVAIMVCVYLNGTTATMNKWMYESMTSELAKYMGKIYVQQGASSYPPFDSTITESTAQKILSENTEDINLDESTPLIFIRTERGMMPFMPANAMTIGLPQGKEEILLGNVMVDTGVNRFSENAGKVVILGELAAQNYKGKINQDILINNQALRVIGILKHSSMESVNMSAIVTLATAQNVFAKENTVSALLLTVKDVNKLKDVSEKLKSKYPLLGITTQEDMQKDAEKVMEMPMMYMKMMSVTAFVVLIIVLMSTMIMAVMERTKEIGTLRAIGMQKGQIISTISLEILILTLMGGIPGALLAIPMAQLMETSLPTFWQLGKIVLFAVVGGLISAFIPAFKAARIEPVEALRYE